MLGSQKKKKKKQEEKKKKIREGVKMTKVATLLLGMARTRNGVSHVLA